MVAIKSRTNSLRRTPSSTAHDSAILRMTQRSCACTRVSRRTAWFGSSQVGDWNYERFSNAEFDKLHTAALSELDADKRAQDYQRMQDLMEESGSYVFLTHGVNAILYRDSVKPALSPDAGRFLFRNFTPA